MYFIIGTKQGRSQTIGRGGGGNRQWRTQDFGLKGKASIKILFKKYFKF